MSKYTFVAAMYLLAGSLIAWAGKFGAHVDYATGTEPHALAVADFNGDGKIDLVTASAYDTVSILLGNGDGSFQPHVDYGTGPLSEPFSVAVGDFNSDGKLDLVTANFANFFGGSVSVLLGKGDGTFQNYVQYATGGLPTSVAVGDFNRDGTPDLAVGFEQGTTVSVLLGKGDGTFQAPAEYDTGSAPLFVAVGDFNVDGNDDLVTANYPSDVVTVLLGKGDGTFPTHVSYTTGDEPEWVAVGDLNGDRKADLAVANFNSATVSVLLGNGDGTFQAHMDQVAGSFPNSLAIGDINGDLGQDLVVTNLRIDSVKVLLGEGDGTLRPRETFKTDPCSGGNLCVRSVVIKDFNEDGAPDLAVANDFDSTVSVLMNTGGTFLVTTSSSNPSKFGQPVMFTTTVTPSIGSGRIPMGTVTFKDGSTTLGTAQLFNGQASLTTSSLTVGDHSIRALYSGNTSFNPNVAQPITQTVVP